MKNTIKNKFMLYSVVFGSIPWDPYSPPWLLKAAKKAYA